MYLRDRYAKDDILLLRISPTRIWSDKLKPLHNISHRETERMELNTIYKRCRGHKERQRRSVQNLYTFLDKYFVHRNFNKIGKQPPIALRTDGASVALTDFFLISLKVLMLLWLFGKLTS